MEKIINDYWHKDNMRTTKSSVFTQEYCDKRRLLSGYATHTALRLSTFTRSINIQTR